MTLQVTDSLKALLQSLHSSEEIAAPVVKENYRSLPLQQLSFIKLLSLTTDDQIPMREAFEYVVSTLNGAQFQFVFLLKRDEKGMHIYIGVVKDAPGLSAVQEARNVEASFKGYFPGSQLKMLTQQEIQAQIIDSFKYVRYAGAVTGIPAINVAHQDKKDDFQGIDRLMNSMGNDHFSIMVIAEPMNRHVISKILESCYELYDFLSVHQTKSVQLSENQSVTENTTESETKSESKSRATTKTTNESKGHSEEISSGRSKNGSKGTSDSINKSNSNSIAKGTTESKGKTTGEGFSETLTYANRKIKEVMDYLDEYLFPKMNYGLNKGMFRTTIYLLAEERQSYTRLKQNTYSIFQGDQLLFNPLVIEDISNDLSNELQSLLTAFSTPMKEVTLNPASAILRGYIPSSRVLRLSTFMSAKELTVFASMPQHEVIGIPIHQGVDFGLNTDNQNVGEIKLGSLLKRGESSDTQVTLQKSLLNKHVFIAGVTGAGKTTTCQKLLSETNVPFWVIEPAKTEYRRMLNNYRPNGLYLFTIGNEKTAPFRFNPFELVEGESIISHVDMLKATFTAAFPMEAAMPQILEAAIYKCYERYGWSIIDDSNIYTDHPFSDDGKYFPTLTDLLEELEAVVEGYKFGNELKQNYIGSLIARVSNLTIGSKGLILNCQKSVDLDFLLHKNVIFELEDLRAPEDKSLVMGLLLSRLNVILKSAYSKNRNFGHITLIEEAHRLLSKVEYGDAPSKKSAVDTFTDMLAEIRKYGESLIIVDQIPNKLAPDIIKNTNTKLIHRLYAKDDQEVIGNAMMMNDEQKNFLSNLRVGEVILFNEQFKKPVHVKIEGLMNKDNDFVSMERLQHQHSFQKQQFPASYASLSLQCNVPIDLESTLQKFYIRFCQFKGGKRKAFERWASILSDLELLAKSANCSVEQLFFGFSEYHMIQTGKLAIEKFKEKAMKEAIDAVWKAGISGELEELETNKILYNWYFY